VSAARTEAAQRKRGRREGVMKGKGRGLGSRE
jgi:hypothetical protein